MLELRTLGTVDLRCDGATVLSVLSQPVRLAILVYLAVARPRGSHRRDVLLNLFWGERDEGAARAALRQSLYRLRQSLGEQFIEGTGEQSVALGAGAVWCDAVEFERALDEDRTADAVALYHGPFLSGFHVVDAPEFEYWANAEGVRLARRAAAGLRLLAETAEARGAFEDAVLLARRVLDIEPEERAWRRLIELLDRQGDRAAALRSYEQLAEWMAAELDAAPSPETQALIAHIRGRRLEEAAPGAHPAGPQPTSSAQEVSGAGIPRRPAAPGQPAPALPPPRTRLPVILGTGLVLGALALGAVLVTRRIAPRHTPPDATAGARAARAGMPTRAPAAASIAVLPFVNLGQRPEEEYFSDGLTEELITTLSRVRSLRVVARTSAFAFKGQNRDVREIGRLLGVARVLEGSVRRDGERVRVSVQLIDASDGFHLWSDTYERRMKDLFDLQTELALRIADALRAELTPAERARLGRAPTSSLDAYTLYLKGRYFWRARSGRGLETAMDYFRRAAAADPGFAAAWAGLAGVYGPLAVHGFMDPARARPLMRAAVLRAVELDPDLAEAHTMLAAYYNVLEFDERRAEREFLHAIELDAANPSAHLFYGYLLGNERRFDESVAEYSRALELDPLSPIAAEGLGSALGRAGRPDAALADFRTALELDSTLWLTHFALAQLSEEQGDYRAALHAIDRAIAYAGPTGRPRAARARLLALTGDTARARALVDSLTAEAKASHIWLPSIALALYTLGRSADAHDWLERAYAQRHPELQTLRVQSAAARMRSDPRFAGFFRRLQPK